MWMIIYYIAKAFGLNLRRKSRISSVSNALLILQNLNIKRKYIAFVGAFMHFIIAFIFFVYLWMINSENIEESGRYIFSIGIATAWLFLGIFLIRLYESCILPNLIKKINRAISCRAQARDISRLFISNWFDNTAFKMFCVAWILIVSLAFISSGDIMNKINLTPWRDISWYVIFFGVIITTGYSTIGLHHAFKGIYNINIISKNYKKTINLRDLAFDKKLGLSTLYNHYFIIAIMLSSGMLFIPLIYLFANELELLISIPLLFLLIIFSAFSLFLFLYPTYQIHAIISSVRERKITNFYKIFDNYVYDPNGNPEFLFEKYKEIYQTKPWPELFSFLLRISVLVVIFPIATQVASAIITQQFPQ